jgi:alginate O-acetyltransferase complex protein AlgI
MPFLLAASLLFYGWGNPAWLLLIAWSMVLNWGGVQWMVRKGKPSRTILILLLILNLLPLFWFKYSGFFADTWARITGTRNDFAVPMLPAGISFFTFQAMSYVIDVYRGDAKVQKNIVTFSVYLSLFPQLVAGPIVRYTDLEQQLEAHPKPDFAQTREGLRRFCTGLAKKVLLADAMGRLWGTVNASFTDAGTLGAWIGLLAFSFQIFFDFSGYSDMAIGLGSVFGFRFRENFNYPYISRTISEFWRRWHISLSTWFKEYLYIPLGGNRGGNLRTCANLFAVFLVTGIWHGAAWTFAVWGIWNGFFIIAERLLGLNREQQRKWYKNLALHCYCILVFTVGWVLFRAPDLQYACT